MTSKEGYGKDLLNLSGQATPYNFSKRRMRRVRSFILKNELTFVVEDDGGRLYLRLIINPPESLKARYPSKDYNYLWSAHKWFTPPWKWLKEIKKLIYAWNNNLFHYSISKTLFINTETLKLEMRYNSSSENIIPIKSSEHLNEFLYPAAERVELLGLLTKPVSIIPAGIKLSDIPAISNELFRNALVDNYIGGYMFSPYDVKYTVGTCFYIYPLPTKDVYIKAASGQGRLRLSESQKALDFLNKESNFEFTVLLKFLMEEGKLPKKYGFNKRDLPSLALLKREESKVNLYINLFRKRLLSVNLWKKTFSFKEKMEELISYLDIRD